MLRPQPWWNLPDSLSQKHFLTISNQRSVASLLSHLTTPLIVQSQLLAQMNAQHTMDCAHSF